MCVGLEFTDAEESTESGGQTEENRRSGTLSPFKQMYYHQTKATDQLLNEEETYMRGITLLRILSELETFIIWFHRVGYYCENVFIYQGM